MKALYKEDHSDQALEKSFLSFQAADSVKGVAKGNNGDKTKYNELAERNKNKVERDAKIISDVVANFL